MKDQKLVLVVDDEEEILKMVARILELEGFAVVTATNGIKGLALLEEHKPDLVLLDIMMPGLDGLQVLDLIRQRCDVPVIMITARHGDTSVRDTIDIGADDYVTKPFSTRELLARIQAKLRRIEPLAVTVL